MPEAYYLTMKLLPARALPAALLAAFLAAGCRRDLPVVAAAPPVVSVSQPVEREVVDYDEYTGRLRAVESVDIRARVRGYIDKVNFQDGHLVKEGDLLFEIDPRPFQAELKAAQSQVAQWQAKLTRAEADVKRYRDLLPKGAASQQDLDRANADAEEARAMIQAGAAAVDSANLDIGFARVTAPIAGKVSRALVTRGNLVSGNAGEESLLTTLVSVDPIYAYFNVNERSLLTYLERARREGKHREDAKTNEIPPPALPVNIALANEEGFPHTGIVDFADNKIDPKTGTIEVRAKLENRDGLFQSGYFFSVRVPVGNKYKGLLVPERAIGTDQGRKYVLTVKSDNTVEDRSVKLGRLHGELRVIEKGVAPEDWVITNGMQRARPGATVDPKRVPLAAEKAAPPAESLGERATAAEGQPVPAASGASSTAGGEAPTK